MRTCPNHYASRCGCDIRSARPVKSVPFLCNASGAGFMNISDAEKVRRIPDAGNEETATLA